MQPLEVTPPAAGSLATFLAGPAINNDNSLSELLLRAENMRETPFLVFDFCRQRTLHVAESITALSGYTAREMCDGGSDFVLKITNPADVAYLMLLQAGFVQEAKTPGFNPCSVRLHDYYWTMLHRNGTRVPLVSTGVILTYSSHCDFGIGVAFHVRNDKDCDARLAQCKGLLREIKQQHNRIHRHVSTSVQDVLYPIHHANATRESITQRERQVLGMLAQGHSTDVIAGYLAIAANTVESHRKKLLQKFEAKNSAELIKKASKVFWLS